MSAQSNWVEDLIRLTNVLYADVQDLQNSVDLFSEAKTARAYVRAVFAFIEGTTFALKTAGSQNPGVDWSAAEELLLQEKEGRLSEKGEVEIVNARLRTKPNIRFAFWRSLRRMLWTGRLSTPMTVGMLSRKRSRLGTG